MITVDFFENFDRKLKRLSKKFRSLPHEIETLITEIEKNPKKGTDLGGNLYKIRLGSQSKGGGKSGGFRVITYYLEESKDTVKVYFATIIDKSEESTIQKSDLLKLIQKEME